MSPLSNWFVGMDAEQKKKFNESLYASRHVLQRLYALIENLENELDNSERSLDEYNSPAFPYLKADRIGERRGLHKIKQLLAFTKE